MSNKTTKKSIFLSVMALIASVTIACGAVLAWFAMSLNVSTGAVKISLIERNDHGFKVSFENGKLIDEDLYIFPESYIDIKLTALRDCEFVKLRLTHNPLTNEEFDKDYKDFFESRADLLLGGYEEKVYTDADGKGIYREFDIAKATTDDAQRLAFLKEFSTQNSLVSAISARIVDKNGVAVENVEFEGFVSDTMVGVDYAVLFGETVTLRIEYGLNDFQPEIKNYLLGNKAQNDYRALSYNCFIGQLFTIEIFGVLD